MCNKVQISNIGNFFFPYARQGRFVGWRERQTPIVANAGRACTHHIAQLCKQSGVESLGLVRSRGWEDAELSQHSEHIFDEGL